MKGQQILQQVELRHVNFCVLFLFFFSLCVIFFIYSWWFCKFLVFEKKFSHNSNGGIVLNIYYTSQIPVITGGFQVQTSYIQCSYHITHMATG